MANWKEGYELIFTAAQQIFYNYVPATGAIEWNGPTEGVLGYSHEELNGGVDQWAQMIHPDDRENTLQVLEQAKKSVAPYEVTYRFQRKDGNYIWMRDRGVFVVGADGKAAHMYGSQEDISERQQAANSLRLAEQQLRLLLAAIPLPMIVTQLSDGRVLYANDQLCKLFRMQIEDILNNQTPDFYRNPADRARFVEVLKTEGHIRGAEIQLKKQDGTIFWAEITIEIGRFQGVVATIAIIEDITDRREAERALEESQGRLQGYLERRSEQLRVSTQVAQEIAATTRIEDLFQRVVTLVKERFGYYHTQLLRYDPAQDAVVLMVGYGETGAQMLATAHRLPLGAGLIGTAAASGQTVLRPDLAAGDPNWQSNPLLPDTKGEIAVPIKWHDTVLGVLDVQSDQAGAIGDEDRLLLEGLCGQIAIAMHNASLVEDLDTQRRTLQAVLDNMPAGVFVAEAPSGKPILANRLAEEMLGKGISPDVRKDDLAEVYAAYVYGTDKLYPPERMPLVRGMFGERSTVDDMEIQRPDGSHSTLQVFGGPIRDASGNITSSIAIFQDITERKLESERIEKLVEERTAQLSDSEARIRSIVEALPMGMHIYHLEGDGRLVFAGANPAADRLLSIENSGLSGKPIEEAFPPLAGTEIPHRYREAAAHGTPWQTQQITINEGQIQRAFDVYAFQTSPNNMVAAFLDVSERIRAEEQLRRQLTILETSSDFIGMATIEGKGIYINPAGLKMTGYSAEEFYSGMGISSFQPDLPRQVLETAMNEQLWQGEAWITCKDNHRIPVSQVITVVKDATGQPQFVTTIARDITTQKQFETTITEERNFSNLVINSLPGVFYIYDTHRRCIRWNQNLEKVTGYTSDEIAQGNVLERIAEEDKDFVAESFQRAFKEGQVSLEAQLISGTGEKIPYFFTATRIQLGNDYYLAGTGIDISERKHLENQVQQSLVRRGRQVQLSTQIAQDIAAAANLDALYPQVVNQIKEQFGYYHVQLLRYNPALDAVTLVYGYGKTGEKMLAAGHRLPMGTGLIGTAAAIGETMLRPDLTNDPEWRPNPLLPETKGEIAIPIKLGHQVLGILDVQSNRIGALSADDRQLLEGLCGQIAIAIEQTRLRQEMEERLAEINALYRAASIEGWRTMEAGRTQLGYHYDLTALKPLTSDLEQAITTVYEQKSVVRSSVAQTVTVAPLSVRGGDIVGALGVMEDPQNPLSEDELALLEQISEQVALALDSARLFHQTQSSLAETRMLYHVSELISRETTLKAVYDTVTRLLIDDMGYSGTWLAEYDAKANMLHGKAGAGNMPEEAIYTSIPVNEFASPATLAIRERKVVMVNDPYHDERMADIPANIKATLGRSIAIPLKIGDEIKGVVAGTRPINGPEITAHDVEILQAIITQVSVAAQRAELFNRIQEALVNTQESGKLVRTIIDSTPDWIFIKDRQHRYRIANKGYADAMHIAAEDFIGKDDLEIGFPEELVKGNPEKGIRGFWADDDLVFETGEAQIYPNDPTIVDGTIHIFNTYKTPLRDAEGNVWGVLAFARDVTEREQAQQATARRARELSVVAELGTQISSILDPIQMLQTVVDLTKESFDLYHAHAYLLNERGDLLALTAGAGEIGMQMVDQGWQIPVNQEKSLVAQAVRSHQSVIVNDVRTDPAYMPNELLPDTRSEIAIPLITGEQVMGVLDVQSEIVNHFTKEDASIYTVLASQVAVALQNARTYAQTQRMAEHEAVINAISARIQNTTSVESALQVAVRELGRALGATRTSVQLHVTKGSSTRKV